MDDERFLPWRLAGTYLESCNCEAICPCRTIGGRPGGRSTYGVCMGALSWLVTEGSAGSTELAGLAAVLACRYDDDEAGSPWTVVLHVDERGSPEQREALEAILLGRVGGTPKVQFPWVRKPSTVLGVHASPIEVDHSPGRGWFRAGRRVTVRVAGPVPDQEPVTCVIPGHNRGGRELVVEELEVRGGPFSRHFSGNCAYEATFDYSSEGA